MQSPYPDAPFRELQGSVGDAVVKNKSPNLLNLYSITFHGTYGR